MSEHWVAVVAAVLGLLGGMGGAAVGGYIANRGEQQRFEHEPAAEIRDLRLDTYVMLLRAAEREHAQPVETGQMTALSGPPKRRLRSSRPPWRSEKRRHGLRRTHLMPPANRTTRACATSSLTSHKPR